MNKEKTTKILISALCFVMIAVFTTLVFATNIGGVTVQVNTTGNFSNKAGNVGGVVLGVIKVVGTIISVGILMVLGIKYMMGSAEEKAEYKKTFIPYIVGAVLLFAASMFANQIYNLASDLFK